MTEDWSHPVFATREEFEQRVRDVRALEEEQATEEAWWLLVFVGEEEAFLGATIVRALGMMHAVEESHRLKLNPGGEVRGEELVKVDPELCNRPLSFEELDRFLSDEGAP